MNEWEGGSRHPQVSSPLTHSLTTCKLLPSLFVPHFPPPTPPHPHPPTHTHAITHTHAHTHTQSQTNHHAWMDAGPSLSLSLVCLCACSGTLRQRRRAWLLYVRGRGEKDGGAAACVVRHRRTTKAARTVRGLDLRHRPNGTPGRSCSADVCPPTPPNGGSSNSNGRGTSETGHAQRLVTA